MTDRQECRRAAERGCVEIEAERTLMPCAMSVKSPRSLTFARKIPGWPPCPVGRSCHVATDRLGDRGDDTPSGARRLIVGMVAGSIDNSPPA